MIVPSSTSRSSRTSNVGRALLCPGPEVVFETILHQPPAKRLCTIMANSLGRFPVVLCAKYSHLGKRLTTNAACRSAGLHSPFRLTDRCRSDIQEPDNPRHPRA